MRKHIKYMLENKDNDARIIMPFMEGDCIIYPSYQTIRRFTAEKIISKLCLLPISGYEDHCNHDVGSLMYIFNENRYK
jgi:hypothetical protein